ncbi:protein FAM83H [Choloepus didactylus]|uniref:protein FAM83H n=1 Tax=Choloepus didactylus TaxID=27675 RepID=UPI00189D28D2|nr:protein FAM83H [Choloepus didactylus]XP_037659429.1 protein FAM83H [Choloepus didactylus]XP_037659430.1 protein FAM83H [Choloepus didactylus]XP_037659431.1 protein FAM83H [Choloepus didactylus]XP_037659432.1 protein FAM83H [Choloepus didactylus]XP_037659433.1 protein FAM83H [Choloepus didactylus]
MARRSQSSSQGDNPLAPGYLPPHYKEYYRLAVDALAEGGPEAYNRFLASEGAPAFLCPEELEHVTRHLQPPQHAAREPPDGSPPDMDMDGSSGTYWPMNSDQAVPELDLGWPLTFGFQGTEVTTLVQPPPPDSPSIKEEARRMIRSAQQVVAVVMDTFTDVDLLSEVLEAAARRVPVYILLDEMHAQLFLDMAEKCRVNLHHVDFLRVRTVAGPTYYCRTGKSFKGNVKEKFLLVDCAVVMSGSYSFMWSFEKIHRSLAHVFQGELVSSFDEEFRILFAQSEPLVPPAGTLARMDAYALAPYAGAGPLGGGLGPAAPAPFSFPKRAHLLFPPPRDEGLGFPSFLDPDRHFLSAFRREEPHGGPRLLSRRLDAEAGPGGELAGPRGFFQARHLEMDAFKRHSYAAADGAGAVENFAAARQVSRQTFLSHGDDLRFQTSHFQRDQLYQQHYQWDPQLAPARPQGLFEKLRAGRPGFAEPEDWALGGGPRFPELGPDGHLRLDYVPSSASREVRHGSDPAFGPGPRGLELGGPQRPNLGQRFPCQAVARPGLETAPEAEPEHRAGPEGRAGLRHWRLASYLSGCHGEDAGDEGLPAPMETESYEDDVLGPGAQAAAGDLLPSPFRSPAVFPAKGPGPGSGGGDSSEREGPEDVCLAKQDSFRARLNPLIQRSSRLRSSLIFASQAEGAGGTGAAATEKVQLLHKEQTVSEALGPGGEAIRSSASAKVAELLEKYKGSARDPASAGAAVTVASHSQAVMSQAWREEVMAPSGAGGERRSLESCLLDLRNSFAQRLHQEAERQPGAATLTATQLLDTLGRGGADRLPSRFLSAQGRATSPQGRESPPPERPGAHLALQSEPKGSPTSALPERKGSPTPGFPIARGSPTPGFTEQKGSPTSAHPERRASPGPPVPERRASPGPPISERRGSLTLTFHGESPKAGPAEEATGGPMEALRKGSLRLRQLLSRGDRRSEDDGSFPVPQENGQPESPRRPSLGRGDSAEAAAGEERGPRVRLASATANALYSSNLRDDTKAILEQISAHGQKHRGAPAPGPAAAHSSPEMGRPPAAGGLVPDMSDKDKCSAIFRSDSLGTQGRLSRTLPASAEERDRLLRRMESMRKEKRVYSRFEVFCNKGEAGGPGAGEGRAEEDPRDSKVGKFMPKILGTFKGKK